MYDLLEQGEILMNLSDREAGILVKALACHRRGLPVSDLPYVLRALFAAESAKIDADIDRKRQVSAARAAAVAQRWKKQSLQLYTKNTNEYNCINPPQKNGKKNTIVSKPAKCGKTSECGSSPQPPYNNTPPPCSFNINIKKSVSPAPAKKKFVKPTVEEVREYCIERKNLVDPEQFVSFYTAKGWMIGKNPMRDWKAAVRTWERKDAAEGKTANAKTVGKYGGAF